MNNQDIRTLKILEEIENNHAPSQRDMARKLNISLGLVNSFIKRLARMGYFKVSTIPANRVKYILTPKGAVEKTRLTYEYIQLSFLFYKDARTKLRKLFKKLVAQKVEKVVFCGVSDLAEIAYVSLQETSIQLVAVVDDGKKGERFLGATIKGATDLAPLSFDRVLLTSLSSGDDLVGEILAAGISRELI
ncbi:MAG: winged helix-turn-helix transcriptional regulator, partial [Desulfobulbaceae bacterium]|nr:winged helix-turn-helix transcriptional regulator [Desulfobulbaceae bacterium]